METTDEIIEHTVQTGINIGEWDMARKIKLVIDYTHDAETALELIKDMCVGVIEEYDKMPKA